MAAKRPVTRTEARKSPRARAPGRRLAWALPAFIVAAGIWAYATSFAGVFVLDDVRAIVRNATIRTLSSSLRPPAASTVSGRPVANLTFAINYALAPSDAREVFTLQSPGAAGTDERFLRNAGGYHVVNLVIHLLAALALFGIVRRTLSTDGLRASVGESAPYLALVVAVLWVLHPLQTASVTYLVQRVESLMGLFYLLTLYCAIRADDSPRSTTWTMVAIASCALGMATKEVMVSAPLIVLLWDVVFRSGHRPRVRLFAGLAATWAILATLVYFEHRAPSIQVGSAMVWRYLLTQAQVITHYIRLSLVPSPLVFLYTWPLASSLRDVAAEAALVGTLLVATIVGVARRHPVGFAGAWFFLILAPTSSVLPIVTEVAAEQRMYLPLAAILVVAVVAARALFARAVRGMPARRTAAIYASLVATLAVAGTYGVETRARNRTYSSEERLWGDTVETQPANQRARVAYGSVLATARRVQEAEVQFRAAVDLEPSDALAQARLGSVLAAQGKFEQAVGPLERALASDPGNVEAHRTLGELLAIRGDDARAVAHLGRAAEFQANDPSLVARLAAILADSRDPAVRDGPRALALAEQAVRLTSRREPLALDILSVAQAAVGQYAEAAATAREALALARARGDQPLASELESRVKAYSVRQGGPPDR